MGFELIKLILVHWFLSVVYFTQQRSGITHFVLYHRPDLLEKILHVLDLFFLFHHFLVMQFLLIFAKFLQSPVLTFERFYLIVVTLFLFLPVGRLKKLDERGALAIPVIRISASSLARHLVL